MRLSGTHTSVFKGYLVRFVLTVAQEHSKLAPLVCPQIYFTILFYRSLLCPLLAHCHSDFNKQQLIRHESCQKKPVIHGKFHL